MERQGTDMANMMIEDEHEQENDGKGCACLKGISRATFLMLPSQHLVRRSTIFVSAVLLVTTPS